MRLQIGREKDSFFVQGEWIDYVGTHTRVMKDDFTDDVIKALEVIMEWADEMESKYVEWTGETASSQILEEEIDKLKSRLTVLKRKK